MTEPATAARRPVDPPALAVCGESCFCVCHDPENAGREIVHGTSCKVQLSDMVSVPRSLLLDVLDRAQSDSFAAEADRACSAADEAFYEAEREKIRELRRYAE